MELVVNFPRLVIGASTRGVGAVRRYVTANGLILSDQLHCNLPEACLDVEAVTVVHLSEPKIDHSIKSGPQDWTFLDVAD